MHTTVLAPAKINLSLDVFGVRPDGYHLIRTIMQAVDLTDTVTVSVNQTKQIQIECDMAGVPCDKTNTATRAAQVFFETAAVDNPGIMINLNKNIPPQAGLAGGSSNAAAVLVALNHLFDAKLNTEQLLRLCAAVGADVPFCLQGGAMLAEGIGTKLQKIPGLPDCRIVIAKPREGVSTRQAFERIDHAKNLVRPDTQKILSLLAAGALQEAAAQFKNVFEQVIDLPQIGQIKQIMMENGALQSQMSGSGSAVFGIFTDQQEANQCAQKLSGSYDQVFQCRHIQTGCQLV